MPTDTDREPADISVPPWWTEYLDALDEWNWYRWMLLKGDAHVR